MLPRCFPRSFHRRFQGLLGEGAPRGRAALERGVPGAPISQRRETRHRLSGDLAADGDLALLEWMGRDGWMDGDFSPAMVMIFYV